MSAPPTEPVCVACGRALPGRFKFCGHCGARQPDDLAENRAPFGPPDALVPSAERRQLTVLFCDLVGSTALADRLDPEELRDTMRLYQGLCVETISRFGGEVAGVAGDGLVGYFGYPLAYEDAAERAVRAGLAITADLGQLAVPLNLQARVGVATGLAIVGDDIVAGGVREREMVGPPPNLAARLQKLAAPNTVVISAATRNIIGNTFRYEDLGAQTLKGFSADSRAFVVTGENVAADRFVARVGERLPPLANRIHEVALLTASWRSAQAGRGRAVLISGEPGIGKSRLVHALREKLADERHEDLLFASSSLYRNTPLYPVLRWLTRRAGLEQTDDVATRRAKLAGLLSTVDPAYSEQARALDRYMAAPDDTRAAHSAQDAESHKQHLFELFLRLLETYALRQPVLLVVEDAQWLDATTRELLQRIVQRVLTLPVLLIVTHRADVQRPPWQDLPHVTALMLTPLDPEACGSVIQGILGVRRLPQPVAQRIVAKTDGVPLFVEELTKAVLEAETAAVSTPVPETLRDTLMARLDRRPDARSIAQLAATIGREFSHELLAMVAPIPEPQLRDALGKLLQSGLIFADGSPPHVVYSFKHALVQETAYESQLLRRRRRQHERIAEALERRFPDTPPEVLGHHQAEAGRTASAIAQYERAAQSALTRSANAEAAAHYGRALALLATLPASRERDRQEFDLQLAYGAQLIAVKGNAADEVGAAYQRAMALAGEAEVVQVLRRLQPFHIVRGQLDKALEIGDRLILEAEYSADPETLLQAHRPYGLCLLYTGQLAAARSHLEKALTYYDPSRDRELRFRYVSDPGVLARCNLAWVEWFQGFPQRALSQSETALTLAKQPEPHHHSEGFALSFAASLHQFRECPDEARAAAAAVIDLAESHRFPYWASWGHVVHGWARVALEGTAAGLQEIDDGTAAYCDTGSTLIRPYFLALRADALHRLGRAAEGLVSVDEALALSSNNNILFYLAELYRLRAELSFSTGASTAGARADLQRARRCATEQGAHALVLRTLLTTWRFADRTDRRRAAARIGSALEQISEGLNEPIVAQAREIVRSTA